MGMKISLCLLVWNELEGCKLDVPKLPRDVFDEIYAVDGGSTDGTVEYLQSQDITVYTQPKNGLNAAYVHANDMSNCDAVVVFFPKATTPTEDLRRFRPLFDQGYQLIIASRQFKGWSHDAFTRMKVLDHGLSIDIEMVVRAYKLRIKRTEFPSTEISRHYGDTRFKIWPTGKKLLAYLWFESNRND